MFAKAALDGRRNSDDYKRVEELTKQADLDGDGLLDRQEFFQLVQRLDADQVHVQNDAGEGTAFSRFVSRGKAKTAVRNYFKMAAEAERYRCWPPPWLVVIMAISQIVFFIFHISHFLTHPAHKGDSMHITWHGPYQFCSKLVFNPRRR